MPDTGARYERIFGELGAGRATAIDFDTRRDADEPGRIDAIRSASGIFMTGGNQLRLTTLLGGTPVAKAIRAANAAGVPVAGPSAGAAFISEHMIAFGDEGSTPIAGSVRLAAQRVERAHQRIEHGMHSGQLTREEAMRLRGEFLHVRDQEARARADGHLDRRERERLHRELDRLERHISALKHNDERPRPRHGPPGY